MSVQAVVATIPEHLLVSVISCADSLDSVFANLTPPFHLLALCSYCADINSQLSMDISSESMQATCCALAAAQGHLCHLNTLRTQVCYASLLSMIVTEKHHQPRSRIISCVF